MEQFFFHVLFFAICVCVRVVCGGEKSKNQEISNLVRDGTSFIADRNLFLKWFFFALVEFVLRVR